MRITNLYPQLDPSSIDSAKKSGTPTPGAAGEGSSSTSSTAAGEKVTVSSQAQELAAKAESEKVQRLAAALQDGTFKIDPHAIAARIVDGG